MENSQVDSPAITLKQRILLGRSLGILIVLGAVATGSLVWHINYRNPRTNDAMVRANIVGIAPEVNGRIVNLPVEDNQYVKQGDLLYVIDPRPYQAKLDEAKANLLIAEKEVDSRRASSGSAEIAIGWRQEPDSVPRREIRRDGFFARELLVAIEEQLVAGFVVNPACCAHLVSSSN